MSDFSANNRNSLLPVVHCVDSHHHDFFAAMFLLNLYITVLLQVTILNLRVHFTLMKSSFLLGQLCLINARTE